MAFIVDLYSKTFKIAWNNLVVIAAKLTCFDFLKTCNLGPQLIYFIEDKSLSRYV